MLGILTLALPPFLVLLGYPGLVQPVFLGTATLLLATAVGYVVADAQGTCADPGYFMRIADTLIILVLSGLIGPFMDVFLIVVVVELARVYRHGRLVLGTAAAAAGLMLAKYIVLRGTTLGVTHLSAADQAQLLLLATGLVVLIVGVSLSTFIEHYAREILV